MTKSIHQGSFPSLMEMYSSTSVAFVFYFRFGKFSKKILFMEDSPGLIILLYLNGFRQSLLPGV